MGQEQMTTVAAEDKGGGALLRRMLLVLTVAVLMAAMAAAPAAAKNSNQESDEPHEPGPPALSGKSLQGTFVAHCKAIDGSDSSLVINVPKEKFSGGGECNPFPQP